MKSNFFIPFLILMAGTFLSGYYGPWWAPSVFIVISTALLGLPSRQSMLAGAASLSLAFLGMMLWMASADEAGILRKTALLLGGLSPALLVIVNTIMAAVTGLLSGWLGSAIARFITKK